MVFFMYLLALLSIEEYGVSSLVGGKVSDLTRGTDWHTILLCLAGTKCLLVGWSMTRTCCGNQQSR